MNERIQELADEAAKFSAILALPTGESGDKLFVEKFAQLIVAECAEVIFETPVKYLEIDIMHIIRDRVKEHFGVKNERTN